MVIVDQVSAAIPVLRALTRARVLFYCHFPDLLLAAPRSAAHRAYRAPLDALEQATTGQADEILVNSDFTRGEAGAGGPPQLAAAALLPAAPHGQRACCSVPQRAPTRGPLLRPRRRLCADLPAPARAGPAAGGAAPGGGHPL